MWFRLRVYGPGLLLLSILKAGVSYPRLSDGACGLGFRVPGLGCIGEFH